MASETNDTAVGAFVLGLTLLFGLTLWWLLGSSHPGQTRPYLIYASDSVAGLHQSSDVLYRGVKVGQVDAIDIDPADPARVRIRVSIERALTLRSDTVAELNPQGVTGQAVIYLQGGTAATPLPLPADPQLAVIPYGASLMSRVEDSLTHTSRQLDVTLQRLDALLSPRHVDAIGQTLAHTQALAAELDRHRDDLGQSLLALRQGSRQLAELSAADGKLAHTLDDVDRAAQSWRDAGAAGARSLASLQQLTTQLDALVRQLQRDPSQLLYRAPPPPPGPGEQP